MLEAQQIKDNWTKYRELVNISFPTRKAQLNKLYDEFEERLVFMMMLINHISFPDPLKLS